MLEQGLRLADEHGINVLDVEVNNKPLITFVDLRDLNLGKTS